MLRGRMPPASLFALLAVVVVAGLAEGARLGGSAVRKDFARPSSWTGSSARGAEGGDADLIESLPLFGNLPSKQYSGFLELHGRNEGSALHYMFVPSTQVNAPLVLWLNGGPGCSSLGGYITEHGPLILNKTAGVIENPFSWHQVANMLYIEGPPGVGFSYCAEQKVDKTAVCAADDDTTAEANLDALRSFLIKFPEYQGSEFFITGESYAGVYVPTLSKLVFESDLHKTGMLKLTGWAVGDPCTDDKAQVDEIDFSPEFALRHGVIDEPLYEKLQTCLSDAHTKVCKRAQYQFQVALGAKRNLYDMYNVYGLSKHSGWELAHDYLNRDDVKEALHVAGSPNTNEWGFCSNIDYTNVYDACNYAPSPNEISMLPIYQQLAPYMRNVLLYNGDVDPSVDEFGSSRAAYAMGFGIKEGGDWRPWVYHMTGVGASFLQWKFEGFGESLTFGDVGEQLGGYVVSFNSNFTFLTIHGSGHMVPEYKPEAALTMFKTFLANGEYAPPLVYPDDL